LRDLSKISLVRHLGDRPPDPTSGRAWCTSRSIDCGAAQSKTVRPRAFAVRTRNGNSSATRDHVNASCSSRKTDGGTPCSLIRLSSSSHAVSSSAGTGGVNRWRRCSSWHFEKALVSPQFNSISTKVARLVDHDIDPLARVQILASLDSKWTLRGLLRDVETRKHFRKPMFCWGFGLVDLVRFELTASSMPWWCDQQFTGHSHKKQKTYATSIWTPRGLRCALP